jgi:release factor glutamine methyltransferase
VRIIPIPGVFRPLSDTRLLASHAARHAPGGRVLDLCTGSGYVAIAAARSGARSVTAVDVSRRAVLAARVNARRNGTRLRAIRGDLVAPVREERFELVVSNPPYVPAVDGGVPRRGPRRAWDAGADGRALLDRICEEAPGVLAPGGRLLLVHSSVCGEAETLERLSAAGLRAEVVDRRPGPLGPLLSGRREVLEERGLLEPGQEEEEVLVVCGRRVSTTAADAPARETVPTLR